MATKKKATAKHSAKAEKVLKTKKATAPAKAAKKAAAPAPKAKKKAAVAAAPQPAKQAAEKAAPTRETKKAVAIAMLAAGATVAELMARLGWLRHTTRSFISVLGRTQKVEMTKTEGGERKYTLAK